MRKREISPNHAALPNNIFMRDQERPTFIPTNTVVRAWAQHPAAAALLVGAESWFSRLLPKESWRAADERLTSLDESPPELPSGSLVILAGDQPAQAAAWAAARPELLLAWVPVPRTAGDEAGALALLRDQPAGPVATLALGEAGVRNAAVLAASILAARGDAKARRALDDFRAGQTEAVLAASLEGEKAHG